jgi:hypothetical protein
MNAHFVVHIRPTVVWKAVLFTPSDLFVPNPVPGFSPTERELQKGRVLEYEDRMASVFPSSVHRPFPRKAMLGQDRHAHPSQT